MGYSVKKHVQILLAVLKGHNIKKVVVSPGTTNIFLLAVYNQMIGLRFILLQMSVLLHIWHVD